MIWKQLKRKLKKISSPAATKIIRENNIDVALVDGTGKGGRITKQDLVNKRIAMGSVNLIEPKQEVDCQPLEEDFHLG